MSLSIHPQPRSPIWRLALAWLLTLAIALAAGVVGLEARRQAWDRSADIRFTQDIRNMLSIGTAISQETSRIASERKHELSPAPWSDFFAAYHGFYARNEANQVRHIDYPPIRLLIAGLWVRYLESTGASLGEYSDPLATPLRILNASMEGLAALGMFLLTRRVLLRCDRTSEAALGGGVVAGLLLWFNPALILEGHAWPQWDCWLLPFFAFAAWAAVGGRWLLCGALLAMGAMFKGQLLMVAPAFVLWPLFAGRIGAVVRVVIGFTAMFALLCSVWLVAPGWPLVWSASLVVFAIVLGVWPRERTLNPLWWSIAIALLIVAALPWLRPFNSQPLLLSIALMTSLLLVATLLRRGRLPAAIGVALIAGIVLCGNEWGGSWSWKTIGMPTREYDRLSLGVVNNVATLLATQFRWKLADTVKVPTWMWREALEMRTLLMVCYGVMLVLASIAMATQHRRRSPLFLVALVLPWVAMFSLMPQMHERYLMWGAACMAAAAVAGVGPGLIYVGITGIAFSQILLTMLNVSRQASASPILARFLRENYPSMAWMLLTLMFALLTLAFSRRGAIARPAPITILAPPPPEPMPTVGDVPLAQSSSSKSGRIAISQHDANLAIALGVHAAAKSK